MISSICEDFFKRISRGHWARSKMHKKMDVTLKIQLFSIQGRVFLYIVNTLHFQQPQSVERFSLQINAHDHIIWKCILELKHFTPFEWYPELLGGTQGAVSTCKMDITLRIQLSNTYNFAAFWPTETHFTSLERSKPLLLTHCLNKRLAAFSI